MPGITERTGLRVLSHLMGLVLLGPCLAGCASMTQDVDAYYRQMAYNYQEALDKAKIDAMTLENQSRVLAVTGDPSKYRKTQRELGKIRSWEEHCAKEKKRFEKAADWMEAHFDIKKPRLDDKILAARAEEDARPAKTSESPPPR